MAITTFSKDPQAVLDYQFDWSSWLADSETISSFTVTATTGLTVDSSSNTNSVVTAWISGGTAGEIYYVDCKIVTNAARTDSRKIIISVEDR